MRDQIFAAAGFLVSAIVTTIGVVLLRDGTLVETVARIASWTSWMLFVIFVLFATAEAISPDRQADIVETNPRISPKPSTRDQHRPRRAA